MSLAEEELKVGMEDSSRNCFVSHNKIYIG